MSSADYSQKVMDIIKQAQRLAISHKHTEVTDLHLTSVILNEDKNSVLSLLTDMGVVVVNVLDQLDRALSKLPQPKGVKNLYVSRDYQRVMLVSEQISRQQFEGLISLDHLFLALLKDEDLSSAKLLAQFDITYDGFLQAMAQRENDKLSQGISQSDQETLMAYGRNLTQEARMGNIDPIIGRDDETRAVIRILSRRIKNNPVLIGEAGVGKTAIVEGLAQRIVAGDVPDKLKDKTIFSLNLTSLISGAMYRGDFEERLEKILEIVKESQGRIILFIDELHNIVGTGAGSSSMDTSNMIKPMLARGEILTIGATTIDEYKSHIEKDAALDRRFQKVLVEEPSEEATLSILRGIVSKYEQFHKVNIQDAALVETVQLTSRFLPQRRLPDVAVDVIDEASALVRMIIDQLPEEIENLQRQIKQVEAEIVQLQKEEDEVSRYRLKQHEERLADLQARLQEEEDAYEKEKDRLDQTSKLKIDLELLQQQIEKAKDESDLDGLSHLMDKQTDLQQQLEELNQQGPYYPVKVEVGPTEVQEIVSQLANMPKHRMESGRHYSIESIQDQLHQAYVGGGEIIEAITKQVTRNRSPLFSKQGPVMSLIIAGISGRGKSYLAECLAETLYDGESSLIRLDMSEFADAASTTKIIGSPPGYVGYESNNHLTEKIRTRPYSVLLLENLNYAHADVFALVKRLVNTGELTDNKNRRIDFSNTFVLGTVNTDEAIETQDQVQTLFNHQSLSEFDDVFILQAFTEAEMFELVGLALDDLEAKLADHQLTLEVDPDLPDFICQSIVRQSTDLTAHDLHRYFEDQIETPIAQMSLQDQLSPFDHLKMGLVDQQLTFSVTDNQSMLDK